MSFKKSPLNPYIGLPLAMPARPTARLSNGLVRMIASSLRTTWTSRRYLALTGASGPSVLQVRAQDVTPANLKDVVTAALLEHEDAIESGAIVVVDEARSRVRILPLRE